MSEPTSPDIRAPQDVVCTQAEKIVAWTQIRGLIDAIPDILLALNSNRQIVFANQAALDFFHADSARDLWGKRPGEAAGCLHSREAPGGCGNAESCRVCGAFLAIYHGLQGEPSVEECRMALVGGTPLDLSVWTRPFEIDGTPFLFLAIKDIGAEKRRQALEKIFFHDLLNTAGGLQSISEIIGDSAPEELRDLQEIIASLSEQLVEEIQAQRDLLSAERGELHVRMREANSRDAVARTISMYLRSQACDGKTIQASEICEEVPLLTDMAILVRVLGNLAKNALEATSPGGTVTVGCHSPTSDAVEFFVHNAACIPRESQLQIFNRSFSTKGAGRGLGTYSVKLLTERFLDGRVEFSSTPRSGTIFFVKLPKAMPHRNRPGAA
ncbi:MAG: PAS domain-containing sensor histidine kinase [Terrimicrobiaceae bacterium]